jgi:hypothetical protein
MREGVNWRVAAQEYTMTVSSWYSVINALDERWYIVREHSLGQESTRVC